MSQAELADLNARITGGQLTLIGGEPVDEPLETGLISGDGVLAYRVSRGVYFLFREAAMAVRPGTVAAVPTVEAREKTAVRDFYDSTGWQKADSDRYVDAERFEDLRPLAADYVRKCHLRVNRYLTPPGHYLLDVASGPIQYDEYLSYSDGYECRICADVSLRALIDARARLGERGAYLLCDITNLPIADEMVDGVVSLHTIYHVPADEQGRAFGEVHRVLRRGSTAVVVYSWGEHWLLRRLASLPIRLAKSMRRIASRDRERSGAPVDVGTGSLYYHPHDRRWLAREVLSLYPSEVVCWRSINVSVMKTFLHERFFGRHILSVLYWFEDRLPHLFGIVGAFPMIVLRKHE
jgi:hypothetical protein